MIMNNIFRFLCVAFIAVSCIRKEDSAVLEDGLVEVRIRMPQVYGHQPGVPSTKAVGDIDDVLDDWPITDLEEGATLWLTYELQTTPDDPETGDVDDSKYDVPNLKAYVVRRSGGGYRALYACEHSVDGGKLVVTPENVNETAAPLYLKDGNKYRFRMISPAMPISKDDLSMNVDNGDSFCSSDQRYHETASSAILITATASGVNYIEMNPMIQQTARLRFNLKKGANVSSIKMMGDGVEITGIQNPYMHNAEGDRYNWSSMAEDDTLVMRLGDKRAWVRLSGDRFEEGEDGNLSGDICILPTDARSNTVTMLLNMAVNGVPTQYITTLNGMVFEHAKSYNMNFEVGLQNNIVVVNWQNVSWTGDTGDPENI